MEKRGNGGICDMEDAMQGSIEIFTWIIHLICSFLYSIISVTCLSYVCNIFLHICWVRFSIFAPLWCPPTSPTTPTHRVYIYEAAMTLGGEGGDHDEQK